MERTCAEYKPNSESIREIDVQTSYDTASVMLIHLIALHAEHNNSFGHDRATTLLYNASIIQDIISSKIYIAIMYVYRQGPSCLWC